MRKQKQSKMNENQITTCMHMYACLESRSNTNENAQFSGLLDVSFINQFYLLDRCAEGLTVSSHMNVPLLAKP